MERQREKYLSRSPDCDACSFSTVVSSKAFEIRSFAATRARVPVSSFWEMTRPEGTARIPLILVLTYAGSSARSFWSIAYGFAVRALRVCGSRAKMLAAGVGS